MKFRILHVTDFHFVSKEDTKYMNNTERIEFHTALRKYLVDEFKGQIDFLLLTGDFGDRCAEHNLTYAKKWLANLDTDLGIPAANIIFCPGNHDIRTDILPEQHHEVRTDHTKGQEYLFSDAYKDSIFTSYVSEIDSKWNPNELLTVYKEFDNVRFVVLNSSWLSQINGVALERFEKSIIEDIKNENTAMYESLALQYGGVFYDKASQIVLDKEGKERVSFLSGMLNVSENKTQQLGFYKNEKIIEAIEKLDNKKINILVFHHPETHLHPFERNYIKDLRGSGFYKYLSGKCHLLICGHTHPVESEDIHNNYYNDLPNFVGGGAHLNEYGANDRPFFYTYEVVTNSKDTDKVEITRDIYLRTDGQFRLAGKEKKNGGLKDTTEINLGAPIIESKPNFDSYETNQGLAESYNNLKAKMRCFVNDSLLAILKQLDDTFVLSEVSKFVKMPKQMMRPDYPGLKLEDPAATKTDGAPASVPTRNMYVKEAKMVTDKVTILFDVIFTDELDFGPERESVAIRIQKGLHDAKGNTIYYPLFVDPLSCLLEDEYRSRYEELLGLKINYFLTKNKISLPRFDQQLPDFYPQLDDVTLGIEFEQELRILKVKELETIAHVDFSGRYVFSES
ncbi:MAG: metallophosphoesterase [Bacteroidetes bacterium]|nr:metallophosphoesterase [Bacteroidota bacterium]